MNLLNYKWLQGIERERERPGFGVALKEVMGAEHRTEAIEDLRTKFQLNLV